MSRKPQIVCIMCMCVRREGGREGEKEKEGKRERERNYYFSTMKFPDSRYTRIMCVRRERERGRENHNVQPLTHPT